MRYLTVTVAATAAILAFGLLAAEAQIQNGAASIKRAADNFTPIQEVACRVRGPHCGLGFTWKYQGAVLGWRCVRC
jgi:hypothetical protein